MQVKSEIKYCKRSAITFSCNTKNSIVCQCIAVSISRQTKNFLSTTNYNCLSSNCLTLANDLVTSNPNRITLNPANFIEGKHFYKENGYFVFTKLYHFLKGTCCGNSCRHCAYGNSKNKSLTINKIC